MAGNATVGILRVLLTMDSAEYDSAIKRVSSLAGGLSKDLGVMGRQATALGMSLTKTLTLPLLGLGAGAIKSASDFESSFAGIKKTVGDATDAMGELTPIGREIQQGMRDLAKQIPINVNELNRIGEAAGQLGIKSQNILGFTKVMADLGVTTNLSSEQAASSLARLANITQMPQDEFDRLGSTVVALGNDLATTESEIVDFGLRIAGAGHLAGLTEAQILSIGGAMSSVGVEAEAGGTAVQKVLLSITEAAATGNKDLAVFAQTAGLSAQEFAAAWKDDAAGAFTLFVEGLGRSGTDAFKILEQLGLEDQRLIRSFLSLANAGDLLRTSVDLGTQAWSDNNALTKEATERYKTFESELIKFWAQVRDVGITLGTALIPAMRDLLTTMKPVIEGVTTAVTWFGKLPEPIRLAAVGIVALAAAIGPVLFVMGQLATGLGLVAGAFAGKGLAIKILTPLMTTMSVTTIPALTVALGVMMIKIAAVTAVIMLMVEAYNLLSEKQARAKGEADEQARRYAMMEQASKIAGRGISTYAEAVEIVTKHIRANVDAQEAATVVYDKAAGPPAALATVHRKLAPALDATTSAIHAQASALNELRKSLSGADAFTDAARWMTVIGEIKDLTELTTEEQQRALTVLQGALDKYNALKQVAPPALLATVIQLDAMNTRLKDGTSHVELLGLAFDEALDPPSIAAAVRELERLGKIQPGFEMGQTIYSPIIPGSVIDTTGVTAGQGLGSAMLEGLAQTLSTQLGPTLQRAFEGGGGWRGAMASMGVQIANAIAAPIMKKFTELQTGVGKMAAGLKAGAAAGLTAGIGAAIQGGSWKSQLGTVATAALSVGAAATVATGATVASVAAVSAMTLGIGAAVVGVGLLIRHFTSVTAEVKQARLEVEEFSEAIHETLTAAQRAEAGNEEWRMTVIAVRDAYLRTGRTAAEAEAIVAQMWDTDNPDRARRAMEEINAVMIEMQRNLDEADSLFGDLFSAAEQTGLKLDAAFLPGINRLEQMGLLTREQANALRSMTDDGSMDLKQLQQDAQDLGIDFNALGQKFKDAKLGASFEDLYLKMQRLISAGGDLGTVLSGSSDEISALVVEAKKFGTSVPAQFKPWIENLLAAGKLVDENGQALKDLSGINFGDPIVTAIDKMTAKLQEFLDRVLGSVEAIPEEVTVRVGVEYDDPGFIPKGSQDPFRQPGRERDEGFASGTFGRLGRWFGQFGAQGTDTRLHNMEAVITPPQRIPFAMDVLRGLNVGKLLAASPALPSLPALDSGGNRDAAMMLAQMSQMYAAFQGALRTFEQTLPVTISDAVKGVV